MIAERIKSEIHPGMEIPKPAAKGRFEIKGWGIRRGSDALIYLIPNHTNPEKPYEKGITIAEFEAAYRQLSDTGMLTRSWLKSDLPDCDKEGPCNFTTIGGIFELLGEAEYKGRGVYQCRKSRH